MSIDAARRALRLVILGSGPVARVLAPLMQSAGFRVSVADDSEEIVQGDAFPGVETLILNDRGDEARNLAADPETYVVLVIRNLARDKAIIRDLLGKGFPYVGIVGNSREVSSMIEELHGLVVSDGVSPNLHAPAGIDLGAETPEEIAISIATEMVATRSGRRGPREAGH